MAPEMALAPFHETTFGVASKNLDVDVSVLSHVTWPASSPKTAKSSPGQIKFSETTATRPLFRRLTTVSTRLALPASRTRSSETVRSEPIRRIKFGETRD